jgi:hypothetical protein
VAALDSCFSALVSNMGCSIGSSFLLKIIYKYTKTLQPFANGTNRNDLQKLLKMPSYEGLGSIEIVYVLGYMK